MRPAWWNTELVYYAAEFSCAIQLVARHANSWFNKWVEAKCFVSFRSRSIVDSFCIALYRWSGRLCVFHFAKTRRQLNTHHALILIRKNYIYDEYRIFYKYNYTVSQCSVPYITYPLRLTSRNTSQEKCVDILLLLGLYVFHLVRCLFINGSNGFGISHDPIFKHNCNSSSDRSP